MFIARLTYKGRHLPLAVGRESEQPRVRLPLSEAPPVATADEANPHFIGRFKPANYNAFPYFNSDAPATGVVVVEPETNTHFVGKFKQQAYNRFNYNHRDTAFPAQAETNTHFIGKFKPVVFSRFAYNHHDTSVPVVAQPNPHFIGKFSQPTYNRFAFNLPDTTVPVVAPVSEANPHFVGRFVSPTYQPPIHLRAGAVSTIPLPPGPPVGAFSELAFSEGPFAGVLTPVAPPAGVEETNPHFDFRGVFSRPVSFALVAQRLYANDSKDASSSAPPPPPTGTGVDWLTPARRRGRR